MLEGLVAWVLNNYLGKYVENLNTDQLSIAMLSGKVELENLPLKKEALRHLGIPIQVKSGFIGKVKLQIPVRQIRSAPWVIAIDKLYIVASPVNLSEWDSEDEMNVAHDLKLSILDALEAQWRAENEAHLDSSYYAASYSSWLSYGTSLVTNIVENLQLKLNDVHIRYEDAITCGERNAFACGLTVESLSAESCDANWQKGFTLFSNDSEGCSLKLLELQKLAIYWDPVPMPAGLLANYTLSELAIRMAQTWNSNHIYIVAPSTAIAHLKRERCEQPLRSKLRPRINCNLTLDQVLLNLTDRQYNNMVGCMQGLSSIGKLRVFRQWRPNVAVTTDAKAWWKYAIKCHYPDHHWMEATPTWDSCLLRAKQMKEYVSICLITLTNPAATLSQQHKTIKHQFEWSRPLQLLKPMREAAMRKVPCARTNLAAEDPNAAGRTMLVRWFPQWWGWYGSPPTTTLANAPAYVPADRDNLNQIQEGQTQANYNVINEKNNLEEEILDVLADSIENNSLLRRDTVFGHFDFTLNKGRFNLSIENSTDDDQNSSHKSSVLELQFSRLCVGVESRPRAGSHAVSVQLGEVCLRDHITPDTLYPVLIAPQGTIREGLSTMNVASNVMSWYKSFQTGASAAAGGNAAQGSAANREPLFQLTYERKPFHKNCDYMLYVKSQSLEVVYNYNIVKWLTDFLSHPFSLNNGHTLFAPAAYTNMRNTTKMHLINKWEHIMQGNLSEREMWQIELDISAPQIMFVEDFVDRNGVVVVVDFGRMQLTNGEPEIRTIYDESAAEDDDFEMFMTPCSTPPGSEISEGVTSPLTGAATSPLPSDAHAQASAINQDTLHLRLYDRYKIELSDLQILVGRARDNWKYAHTKGSSSLHLLDRFNISLQAERRVVYTSDPQFPSATLCGTLPNLVVHLNEHKLAAVNSILHQINSTQHSPSTSGGDVRNGEVWKMNLPVDEASSEHSDTEQTERSSNQLSKLLMVQFAIDQMSLEVQSRGRSIVEVQVCGVRVTFTKRPLDYSLSLSVHSLLLVDALQTYGPDFELLVASHKHVGMDSVSGSIRDSEPTSPTSPASPDGRPPAAPPPPAALSQALHSLHSLQKPAATSGAGCASPVLYVAGAVDSEALIMLEVTVVHAQPDQLGQEDLRIANILFNNLDIIANQETIVELIGFTQRVLSPKTPTRKASSEAKQAQTQTTIPPMQTEWCEREGPPVRTEVTFDFHRLSVLLLRACVQDGGAVVAKKIATATMSEAKIQATIGNETLEVKGSLGGLQVVSLCPGSSVHQRIVSVGQDSLQTVVDHNTRLMSCLAQELYKGLSTGSLDSNDEKAFMFNIKRTVEYPTVTETHHQHVCSEIVNASVCVHMASVWYTHSALFISELQSCVTEFKQYLSNLARSIKAAAADMAIGFVQPRAEGLYSNPKFCGSMEGVSPRRPRNVSLGYSIDADSIPDCFKSQLNFSLDVELETPVVVLPRSCSSSQVFVAHLGKMFISNRPGPSHYYHLQVRDISLYSLDIASRLNKYHISADNMQSVYNAGKEGKPVLHNTTLHLTLESLDVTDDHRAQCQQSIKIIGKIVTPLRVSATRNQYEQLLETVKTLSESPDTDTASHNEQDSGDAADTRGTTLSVNPHVLAVTHPLIQPASTHLAVRPSLAHIEVNFQLPYFTVELRGDFGNGERSLVDLSFRDFSVNYDKCQNQETNIQVSLHSITMEDLTRDVESKYRLMMVSHTPHVPKAVFVSRSCPDFMTEYNETCSGNAAARLQHNAGAGTGGSLPNHMNLLDKTEGVTYKNIDELENCGRTPPSSPYFTPYNVPDGKSENETMSADDNLVLISVQIRDPQHPLFQEKYRSVQKLTKVDFNCLNLVVSVDSWVAVLDFFGIVSDNQSEHVDESAASDDLIPTQKQADEILGITETEMSIRSLSIVLLGHRGEVCRSNISRLSLKLWSHEAHMQRSVSASLGSISLTDLTEHATVWRERFLTSGKEALNFSYRRLSPEEATVSECDTTLSLEMSSIRYVHTKRFVAEIQTFFREFSQLQRVLIQARHKVSVGAMSSRSNKMRLNIECWSPVILVPVSGRSNSVLVIDLGLLSLKNSFKKAGSSGTISSIRQLNNPIREMLDVRVVQLENMDLYCAERHSEGELVLGGARVRKRGPSLLTDNCHLVLQIENNMESYHNVADTSIHGTLNTLECALDPEQYKLIRGLLSYNLGENIDDLCSVGITNTSPMSSATASLSCEGGVWTLWSLRLDLLNVVLRLETEHGVSSLACINFIKSKLLVETFSDLTQDIDLVSQEILVSDTRYQSEPVNKRSNVFTNIVQPISDSGEDSSEIYSVQAEVHARKRADHSAYTILVNNMRLMAILDWWDSVNQFIMQPAAPVSEPLHLKYNLFEAREQIDGKCSPQISTEQIELKLNITESQIVLVEDTSLWDTNAVILKSTTVISYRPGSDSKPVSCVLNHCEVFSCVIGMEEETALSIIDPVTVHIDINANNVLQLQVSTLDVRLSYHDVRMFADMLHSLPAQARPPAPANMAASRLSTLGFSARDCAAALTHCSGHVDEAALWLTRHAASTSTHSARTDNTHLPLDKKGSLWPLKCLQVRADCITVCVIDDCLDSDVPLLEVSLSELWVSQDTRWGVEPVVASTPQSPPLVPPTPVAHIPSLNTTPGSDTEGGSYWQNSRAGPGGGRLECVLSSDYYNRGLSGWEPVIEPWKCEASWEYTLTSKLNRNRLQLEVNSTQVLNLNVTSSLIELYSLVKTNWTQDYYATATATREEISPKTSPPGYRRRSPFVPFALSNQTGIKLWFTTFITNSDVMGESSQVSDLDESWSCVKAGETCPFAFGSVRGRGRRRGADAWHQLGVRLEGWGAIGPVCVDKIGVIFRHAVHLKTDLDGRVVFSVTLEGSARKLITVRSALQLVNELPQPVEVRIDNAASGTQWGMASSRCVQVSSGATWNVPLAPNPQPLWVRPVSGGSAAGSGSGVAQHLAFMYCATPLDWRAAARRHAHEPPMLLHNVCHSSADQVYRFGSVLRREKYPADRGVPVPGHTFILRPALRLINLLPVDLQYSINSAERGSILPGDTQPFHQVNVEDTVEISFKLDGFANSTLLSILPTATTSFSTKVKLIDVNNRRLYLNAHISIKRTDTVKISISSPYWIVNRTGIPLVFRQEGIVSETAGQYEEHEIARMVAPLLFSFAQSEGSPTVVARVGAAVEGHSQWCSSFGLGPGVLVRRLSMKAARGSADKVFLVGVLVRPGRGRYRHTNICTISPRYQIHNNTSYHLQFAQKCYATMLADPAASASHVSAVSGCYMPFHWARQESEQLLCVRPLDVADCHWSGGFRIDTNNSMHIGCRDPYGSYYFLRLEVVLQGATFFVVFTDADTMPPSIRIENFSPVSISFHQVACKEEVTIKPHGSTPWALSEPCGSSAVVLAAPGGSRATLDLQVLGKGQTISYQNFIYVAFTGTHPSGSISDTKGLAATVEESQMVLEVHVGSNKVLLGKKRFGDRSQLWRRGPNNQLVHEGSSPPQPINITNREDVTMSPHSMVLDIEGPAPRPGTPVGLCLRRPDARRVSTQSWRFTSDGRMCCAHSNMCVQPADGFFGLRPGNRVILGLPDVMSPCLLSSCLPIEQAVSAHTLRPGSGYLNVSVCADGPTRVIEIHDTKNRDKGWCEGERVNRNYTSVASTDDEFELRVALGGLGVSIVSKKPAEELVYAMFSGILTEIGCSSTAKSFNLSVKDIQFDNQVLGAVCPVVVWMTRARSTPAPPSLPALQLSTALTPSHPARNYNAHIFRHLIISLRPVSVRLEERLLLKLYAWLGRDNEDAAHEEADETDFETQRLLTEVTAVHATRYYFGVFRIIPSQIRLSMQTASKLEARLSSIKRKLRLKLIKFEDAGVELEPFERWHPFESSQFLWHTIIKHFKDELKWQAAKILVSVDFLGNPLGFMQDVSEGVSGLLYEGNVGALVKNVTHGISNSAAKMTESLGDGLECVVVDKAHEETRRRIRHAGGAGTGHLVAGFRGLGLGLLGGMTSLVKHSYEGATQEGIPGFLTGVGKGLMGTVTKPVIGVLDLAAETASALRETSRRSYKWIPERMRLARCAAGRGGLLPRYSSAAATGLRFLHTVNGDDHAEGFIAYEACRDAPHDIRVLLSTQHLRIFTCRAGTPQIVLEMHLSNLICCSAVSECSEHYVELVGRVGAEGGGVRRPRVQCDSAALARAVAAHANYAKRLFHDTLHTLPPDTYDD